MCKHNVSGTTKTFLELAEIIHVQWNSNPAASLVDWLKVEKQNYITSLLGHQKVNVTTRAQLHLSHGCWIPDSRTMVPSVSTLGENKMLTVTMIFQGKLKLFVTSPQGRH